ncbi:DNA-binding protein [Pseudomonas aeruginosa]
MQQRPWKWKKSRLKTFARRPPVLPWRDFANWIGMGEDHETVRGWIRKGYLPAYKIGKHVMVNVALFTHQLMEKEEF